MSTTKKPTENSQQPPVQGQEPTKSTQQPSLDGTNTPVNNGQPDNAPDLSEANKNKLAEAQEIIDKNEPKNTGLTPEQQKLIEKAEKIVAKQEQDELDAKKKEDQAGEAEIASNSHAKKFAESEAIPVLKKTRENYVPSKSEEKSYHAVVEVKNFNAGNGKRRSRPELQKFSPAAWRVFKESAFSLGYSVTILHDPTGEYPDNIGVPEPEPDAEDEE